MQVTIEVKDILYPILQQICAENNLTAEEYAGNVVEGFLAPQYRAFIARQVQEAPLEDLAIIKDNKLKDLKVKNKEDGK